MPEGEVSKVGAVGHIMTPVFQAVSSPWRRINETERKVGAILSTGHVTDANLEAVDAPWRRISEAGLGAVMQV